MKNEEVNIISFLKTRKSRPNMAAYVLSEDDYKTVAALHLSHGRSSRTSKQVQTYEPPNEFRSNQKPLQADKEAS